MAHVDGQDPCQSALRVVAPSLPITGADRLGFCSSTVLLGGGVVPRETNNQTQRVESLPLEQIPVEPSLHDPFVLGWGGFKGLSARPPVSPAPAVPSSSRSSDSPAGRTAPSSRRSTGRAPPGLPPHVAHFDPSDRKTVLGGAAWTPKKLEIWVCLSFFHSAPVFKGNQQEDRSHFWGVPRKKDRPVCVHQPLRSLRRFKGDFHSQMRVCVWVGFGSWSPKEGKWGGSL